MRLLPRTEAVSGTMGSKLGLGFGFLFSGQILTASRASFQGEDGQAGTPDHFPPLDAASRRTSEAL